MGLVEEADARITALQAAGHRVLLVEGDALAMEELSFTVGNGRIAWHQVVRSGIPFVGGDDLEEHWRVWVEAPK